MVEPIVGRKSFPAAKRCNEVLPTVVSPRSKTLYFTSNKLSLPEFDIGRRRTSLLLLLLIGCSQLWRKKKAKSEFSLYVRKRTRSFCIIYTLTSCLIVTNVLLLTYEKRWLNSFSYMKVSLHLKNSSLFKSYYTTRQMAVDAVLYTSNLLVQSYFIFFRSVICTTSLCPMIQMFESIIVR